MTGCHAGRKRIDYAYAFSYVFHSAGCIKMGSGKWRSTYFRQDVRKIDFYAPNFEKVGSILLSACPCVRPFKKKLKLGF